MSKYTKREEMKIMMENGYFGIDLSQIILGGAILLVFAGFVIWGIRSSRGKPGNMQKH